MTRRAPNNLTPAGTWANAALCRYDDPEIWFTDATEHDARLVCGWCPVRQHCLDEAMAADNGLGTSSRYGVYGGLTGKERAKLAARRRKLAPVPPPAPATGQATEPCGTPAAYRRHFRRKETPCEACRTADRVARYDRMDRAKTRAS